MSPPAGSHSATSTRHGHTEAMAKVATVTPGECFADTNATTLTADSPGPGQQQADPPSGGVPRQPRAVGLRDQQVDDVHPVGVHSHRPHADGVNVVDLLVAQPDGPGLAADAAAGRISLLLLPQ